MIRVHVNLGDLDDVMLDDTAPADRDVLTFDSTQSKWVPRPGAVAGNETGGGVYVIETDRWGIRSDGADAAASTRGINRALAWAKSQGFIHTLLPQGRYKLQIDSTTFSCIVLQSDMKFEMAEGCVLELETNSSPWYAIFDGKGIRNASIIGGKVIGDKNNHTYQISVGFVRGGVNPDGSPNDNPGFIRSEVIDRHANPGLLKAFRVWAPAGITAPGYSFYQYKDTVSNTTLAGSRTNGQFAPASPTGRGWFADIEKANKMIVAIDIGASPLTDAQISELRAKIDSQNYTHEWGHGIHLKGCTRIDIRNVEISHCTGDAVNTAWLEYKPNPSDYTQEQMGSHIAIAECDLHHCRRQGISLCGSNDIFISNNKIHHIGRADDNATIDGTPPMFGIDIESMWSESNIPTWRPELNQDGFELNTRIRIRDNYIYDNARGHFVNADGIHVLVENNTFEGYTVGGILSYPANMYVKYVNNTFVRSELVVSGDNYVNGAVCEGGNVKLSDVRGAVIRSCHIRNGLFYGSSIHGYFGTPAVNTAAGTFSYAAPHGMGNGAKIIFEQWVGKVPAGIRVEKLYYAVNVTPNSFQVSETVNGPPVKLTDPGTKGFNISRFHYGRCYISDITVERDWRGDNALSKNFSVILTGGVIRNVTVKNYEVDIRTPPNYAGRPITVEGLTVIEGGADFECSNLNGCSFSRAKTGILGGDINLGSPEATFTRKIFADHCLFHNVGINCNGNAVSRSGTLVNCTVRKADNTLPAMLLDSYLENCLLGLNWLTKDKLMTIAGCTFNNVTAQVNANTRMIGNVQL